MHRMKLAVLLTALAGFALSAPARADQASAKQELERLNKITGLEPLQGALKGLLDDPKLAKETIQLALPKAKNKDQKDLSYNAAFALGLAAAEQKDLKTAEAFFRVCMDQAAKLQSVRKLVQAYGTLIELYYNDKKYADSARISRELIDLKTDDGKPRIVYRAFTDERGETDFIEDTSFDSARRIRPLVKQTLVKALAKQGKTEQALKLVEELIKGESDWRDQHLKVWVLREAGQAAKAAELLEDVVTRVQKDADLSADDKEDYTRAFKYELSNLYVEQKKIDKAAEQLEYLVKKYPDEPGFQNDLGYILADNDKRLDEAEKLIRRALELDEARRKKRAGYDPKADQANGAYLDSLGWVLYKKKDYEGAKKYLQQAVEDKAAQHIEIYDHLGDVLIALGERDAAIRAWQKGLEVVGESRRDQERKAAVERKLAKYRQAAK